MYLLSLFSLFFITTLFNSCLGTRSEYHQNNTQIQKQCKRASSSRFVGTLVPVFTPADKYSRVKYDTIPKYVKLLCSNGINGIILFSVQTAGLLCTQEEKKLLAKTWVREAKRQCNMTVVCQVGGTNYNESLDLTKYCKRVGADAIMTRPVSDYPASSVDGVVRYLEAVARVACPKPFLYSDLEFDCNFDYSTTKIVRRCKELIKNFAGVITTSIRALKVMAVVGNSDISVISADSADVLGPYAYCLNGTSSLIANIFPGWTVRAIQIILAGEVSTSVSIQKKMNRIYFGCLSVSYPDRVDRSGLGYKIECGRLLMWIVNGIYMGETPTPLPTLTRDAVMRCYKICQREGVANYYPGDYMDDSRYPDNNDDQDDDNKNDEFDDDDKDDGGH